MKLLVVDDDPIFLALIELSLESAGYRDYVTATSAEDALKKIEQQKDAFECFLLDIQMPGMNGIELCKKIRSGMGAVGSQIIMVTAAKDKGSMEDAFHAGANDYVNKPLDFVEFQTRLRLAEELVEKSKELGEFTEQVSKLQRQVSGLDDFTISTAITLPDIPNFISKIAMENYLLALTKPGLFKTKTIGFAIAEFEEIFLKAEPEDVYYLLCDVANAIAASLRDTSFLLTYAGYGKFICATGRQAGIDVEELESHVMNEVVAMGLEYDTGEALDLHVLVGSPQFCTLMQLAAPLSLARNAISSVEEARIKWNSDHSIGFRSDSYRQMRQ
ncbi:response regulator [Aliiroseovarius sp.]|uniref:response regulator n=1 Tax=Aliiroseovarius sp. TaxID=1872442 RepID=UPI00261E15FF|nr:response regulator [Aliiroseovarius sp.]